MQDLENLLMKLRNEHHYCLYCGCKASSLSLSLSLNDESYMVGLHCPTIPENLFNFLEIQVRSGTRC